MVMNNFTQKEVSKMKRILIASAAIALVWASSASAMVTISKHNFTLATNTVRLTDPNVVNGEVCVFCHTPHGAASEAPLWNRQMATAGAYTPYTSSTLDAPGANADRQPKGISLACLSCHDGTIAIDALRNAPGSGNYDASATTRAFAFNGLAGGNVLNAGITNLTQDLTSQHPISIEYPKYGAKTGAAALDAAFYEPGGYNAASGLRWFEEGGIATKADDNEVRLFATNGTGDVFVECASCHNPHGTQNTGPGVDFPTFLRKSNNQSALCTTCHIK